MRITHLNLWVLGQTFGVNIDRPDEGRLMLEVPNQIEATSAPHLRRCIKAGLLEPAGKLLRLTEAGIEALINEGVRR